MGIKKDNGISKALCNATDGSYDLCVQVGSKLKKCSYTLASQPIVGGHVTVLAESIKKKSYEG